MEKFITKITILCLLILASCQELEGPMGLSSLISMTSEGPGSNCINGGLKIQSGIDKNKNQKLDNDEVDVTNYVCNGTIGDPGLRGLITVTPEPFGTNCPSGGYKINTGTDTNKNNILDSNEVSTTAFICNGLNGSKSLVKTTIEPAGINCIAGGYNIQTGLDANNNNTLDVSEISSTQYVCHGKDGNSGAPATPDYTLSVDGKLNCILLNSSVATSTTISAGTYSVAVSGNAFFAPSASHKRVLIRYSGSDDDHLQILSIGASKTLGFRSGKLYAFFADWQSIDDNSGSVNIEFGGTTLPVHGKNNCVLLNTSVAASANIPAGVYKVKVTGNAFFSPGATHYDVFVRYAGSLDDELDILAIGGEKTLSLRNGDKFYAFFADWDNVADNGGTIKIEFYKQ